MPGLICRYHRYFVRAADSFGDAGICHEIWKNRAGHRAAAQVFRAHRICQTLRSGGIEVWFDRNELRGGELWDRQIRTQIHDCALFVAVISANTQARLEGYFAMDTSAGRGDSAVFCRARELSRKRMSISGPSRETRC